MGYGLNATGAIKNMMLTSSYYATCISESQNIHYSVYWPINRPVYI